MKLSEIVGPKSALAIISVIVMIYCPNLNDSLLQSVIYVFGLSYILWYCYSSYIEYQSNPQNIEKQKDQIKQMHNKMRRKL